MKEKVLRNPSDFLLITSEGSKRLNVGEKIDLDPDSDDIPRKVVYFSIDVSERKLLMSIHSESERHMTATQQAVWGQIPNAFDKTQVQFGTTFSNYALPVHNDRTYIRGSRISVSKDTTILKTKVWELRYDPVNG